MIDGKLVPKTIVTDDSFANINAILSCFQLGNLQTYLDKLWKEQQSFNGAVMTLCHQHVFKQFLRHFQIELHKLKAMGRELIKKIF